MLPLGGTMLRARRVSNRGSPIHSWLSCLTVRQVVATLKNPDELRVKLYMVGTAYEAHAGVCPQPYPFVVTAAVKQERGDALHVAGNLETSGSGRR